MAKYRQTANDRLDESLGERRGPERDFKQSYKDRRDESRGMKKAMDRREDKRSDRSGREYGKFDLRDNVQAGEVKYINTNSEQYDLNRIRPYECGSRGYPAEAWNYEW